MAGKNPVSQTRTSENTVHKHNLIILKCSENNIIFHTKQKFLVPWLMNEIKLLLVKPRCFMRSK